MNVIETRNLTKHFGETKALNDVSLHVREGEIYGFLGLNGAGKTTAIKLMLSMIRPTKGTAKLFGKSVKQSAKIWNDVGYLVETPFSYPNLSVKENLEVIYKLRGLKDKSVIDSTIELLHLLPYKNKKAKHLSMGNNQRLGLAKALLHRPRLLILDEPINGLDPAGIVEIRDFLKELAKNHTTIFLSSHILSEISKLATRIGIVHEGNLIKEINSNELDEHIEKKLLIDSEDNSKVVTEIEKAGFKATLDETGLVEIKHQDAIKHSDRISLLLVHAGIPPKMLYVYEEDLETWFLRMINQNTLQL